MTTVLTIPAGYRLAILTPDGTVLDTIDLEGANLDRAGGASSVSAELAETIRPHMTEETP